MIAQTTFLDLLSFCPCVASLRLILDLGYYHSDIWDISITREFISMKSLGLLKKFCPK